MNGEGWDSDLFPKIPAIAEGGPPAALPGAHRASG